MNDPNLRKGQRKHVEILRKQEKEKEKGVV